MYQAFKSLTPVSVEITSDGGRHLTVKVVSDQYASQTLFERNQLLTRLLLEQAESLAKAYIITYKPLTTIEASGDGLEFSESAGHHSNGNQGNDQAAKEADI